jgi:putative mRNA 3-end processing factor
MGKRAGGARAGGPSTGRDRAFRYLRGVRLPGTNIACDAAGGELVFLAHAQALGALGRRQALLRRAGHQELLVTEATLALLGPAGTRMRKHALPAPFGRPFVLGEARVELFSAGHLPGSASLLVERAGRSVVYAGTVCPGRPGFGAAAAELRPAAAVCVDATFGDPRYVFPPIEEALALARRFVSEARAAGAAPVLLAPPFGTALELGAMLVAAGHGLRGHRAVMEAAGAFRDAGVAVPPIARFAGALGPDEVLLWPPEARDAPLLARLPAARFAYVSGFSLDPAALQRVRADQAIPLSNQADFPQLLAYIQATGAREVAVHRGHTDQLTAQLRQRGFDAYALGPPRQMELFRG